MISFFINTVSFKESRKPLDYYLGYTPRIFITVAANGTSITAPEKLNNILSH